MRDAFLFSDATQRARAARRMAAVRAVREGHAPSSGTNNLHLSVIAARFGVSLATLRRWCAAEDGVAAQLDAPRSGRPGRIWRAAGAEEAWGLWLTDYLRPEKPTAVECLRRVLRIAAVRAWEAPRNVKAYLRRLKKEISTAELVRAREGVIPLLDLQPAQQRSVAALRPLDIINGDGRRHDLMVVMPCGDAARPVVWYWQDVYSRRILAWQAGETESAEMVRLSLHEVVVNYGVPGRVLVDSTRAAANKWLTGRQRARRRWRSSEEEIPGILHLLGVGYSCTAVDRDAGGRGKGRGRSKPIERAFADFGHAIDTHPLAAGAYTGRSPMERPETHRQRPIDWACFRRLVAEGVAEYNARVGRETEVARGRSFDEVFADGLARASVRRLSKAQASLLLLAVESSKVRRDGTITLKAGRAPGIPKNRYHHIDLVEYAGRNLVVRFDPAQLHGEVYLFDQEGRYVCAAQCLHPVGFGDVDSAREFERQRRRFRKTAEKGIEAKVQMERLREEYELLAPPDAPEMPQPAALRVVTGAPSLKAPASRPSRRAQLLRGLRRSAAD